VQRSHPRLPGSSNPAAQAEAPRCPICGEPAAIQSQRPELRWIGCYCQSCGVFWWARGKPRRPVETLVPKCDDPGVPPKENAPAANRGVSLDASELSLGAEAVRRPLVRKDHQHEHTA
jgi:hypothetical protein